MQEILDNSLNNQISFSISVQQKLMFVEVSVPSTHFEETYYVINSLSAALWK